MTWVRDGAHPEQIKVSFIVSAKEHPELTRFILSLPYRGMSKILRDILSSAVKNAGAGNMSAPQPVPVMAQSDAHRQDEQRVAQEVSAVSAAAAGIIESFDKMFPSS